MKQDDSDNDNDNDDEEEKNETRSALENYENSLHTFKPIV